MAQADRKREPVVEELIVRVKDYFGDDAKRIAHTMRVLDFADDLQAIEGGDRVIALAGAVLHDVGIPAAEIKYSSSAGKYQEELGPAIAKELMADTALSDEEVEHVCKIVANHHSARNIDTLEFRIVYDADWLVNIPIELPPMDKKKLADFIHKTMKTDGGRRMALKMYTEPDGTEIVNYDI